MGDTYDIKTGDVGGSVVAGSGNRVNVDSGQLSDFNFCPIDGGALRWDSGFASCHHGMFFTQDGNVIWERRK